MCLNQDDWQLHSCGRTRNHLCWFHQQERVFGMLQSLSSVSISQLDPQSTG